MPKRPHSSWNLSSSSSPSSSGDMSLKAAPPRVSHTIDGYRDHGRPAPLDHQGLASHPPYPTPGQRELAHEPLEVTLGLGPHRHHHPRWSLSEEEELRALGPRGNVDLGAHQARPADAALGHRHRHASLGTIMGSAQKPRRYRCAAGLVDPALLSQVEGRQRARHPPMEKPQVLGAAQAHVVRTEQSDPVPLLLEPLGATAVRFVEDPGHADHGSGQDRLPQSFIVEGDVAAYHRDIESAAGLRDARDRLLELPEDFWTLGRAEIQAVRQPERLGARDGEVPRRLGHSHGRAGPWIEIDETVIAVSG